MGIIDEYAPMAVTIFGAVGAIYLTEIIGEAQFRGTLAKEKGKKPKQFHKYCFRVVYEDITELRKGFNYVIP